MPLFLKYPAGKSASFLTDGIEYFSQSLQLVLSAASQPVE